MKHTVLQVREQIASYVTDNEIELTDILIALTGTNKTAILKLASMGIRKIAEMGFQEYIQIGLNKKEAAQLTAAFRLSEKLNKAAPLENTVISNPNDVAQLMMGELRYLKIEKLFILMLNAKNKVIKKCEISRGTINSTVAGPREVFAHAITARAASIIICHNHPSGDPTASQYDVELTKRLIKCGELLNIDVLDHIIIGDGRFTSMRQDGLV